MDTIQRAFLVGVPVFVLLGFSLARWWRRPTTSARAQLLGAVSALAVVLAHVAEAFQLWPSMGWGQPDTIGHYTDLVSALLAMIFLSAAIVLAVRARARPSRHSW